MTLQELIKIKQQELNELKSLVVEQDQKIRYCVGVDHGYGFDDQDVQEEKSIKTELITGEDQNGKVIVLEKVYFEL